MIRATDAVIAAFVARKNPNARRDRFPGPAVVLVAALLGACAGTQTIHLTASEPAEIWRQVERVCASTPCQYSYPRQGCGFPRLMATNSIVFEARAADGRHTVMGAVDYCDVDDRWHFVIPPAGSPAP
jgi:hypothetical protein